MMYIFKNYSCPRLTSIILSDTQSEHSTFSPYYTEHSSVQQRQRGTKPKFYKVFVLLPNQRQFYFTFPIKTQRLAQQT